MSHEGKLRALGCPVWRIGGQEVTSTPLYISPKRGSRGRCWAMFLPVTGQKWHKAVPGEGKIGMKEIYLL